MDSDQRRVHDETVAGRRGRMPAPLLAWLRSPEMASRAQKLGEFVRYETSLPPRLSELAILLTARFWTSQYEWALHKAEALKAGLDPAAIDAIAHRELPQFQNHDEEVVQDFVVSLHRTHAVPDDVYREAVAALGERGVVELVGLLGYYTLIAMTVNTFDIEAPGEETKLPP